MNVYKLSGCVASIEDPDQTPRSDVGLHCLLRPACPHRVSTVTRSNKNPFRNHCGSALAVKWSRRLEIYRSEDHTRCITKTHLFKYIENLTSKNWTFSDKNCDIFHIFAQNINCGYSLEPPHQCGSYEYPQFMSRYKKNSVNSCKPQFYYIKVGFKGVKII